MVARRNGSRIPWDMELGYRHASMVIASGLLMFEALFIYRRRNIVILLLFSLVATGGCRDTANSMRLAEQTGLAALYGEPAEDLMRNMASLLAEKTGTSVDFVNLAPVGGSRVKALQEGLIDMALLENSIPYADGVRSVLPLFRGVLHVLHRSDMTVRHPRGLFEGTRIYIGKNDTMSQQLLHAIVRNQGVEQKDYVVISDLKAEPDVIMFFAPVLPRQKSILNEPLIVENYRFFSFSELLLESSTSPIEGIRLFFPQMQPIVIPAFAYGELTPLPILTLSVDVLLVASDRVSEALIYNVTQAIIENRAALAASMPSAFDTVSESFDVDRLNFPLHAGARRYLERREPSFIERYAEAINLSFYLFFAGLSLVVGFIRWTSVRKKHRIDRFYDRALDFRGRVDVRSSPDECLPMIIEIRALQYEAFNLLIAEKLAPDESFHIFLSFTNDTIAEIRNPGITENG